MPEAGELDVVVANASADRQQIEGAFPTAKVVDVPPNVSIARARHAALQQASGSIVAMLHERYRVPKNWGQSIRRAHESHAEEVIAGTVAPPAHLPASGWAMYLSEYARVAPPLPSEPLERASAVLVPGGNVSYKRAVLEKVSMKNCLWELDFHAALYDRGGRFYRDTNITAELGTLYSLREYLVERWAVSRDYAARRASGLPLAARVANCLSRGALPPLVMGRVAVVACRKRAYFGHFITALPWIAIFSLVQACGEAAGSIRVPPAISGA